MSFRHSVLLLAIIIVRISPVTLPKIVLCVIICLKMMCSLNFVQMYTTSKPLGGIHASWGVKI